MPIQIQYRRGTASQWGTANTLLALGEPGYETDTGKFKVGDGTRNWTNLPYATIQPRVSTTANTATLSWNSDYYDTYIVTGLGTTMTIPADSGSPVNGQKMLFRIKDDGTARTLSITTGTAKSFRAMGAAIPTTTTAGKTLYLGVIYNATDSRWDLVTKSQEP